jgi:hypothetical protein
VDQLEERSLLTFAAPFTVPLANVPQCFALGDFNGDGKLDMAVEEGGLDGAPFQLDMLMGNGDGTFQKPVVAYTFGPGGVSILEATDLNHDGKMDLLALGAQELDVFLGNGNGTFQAPATYHVAVSSSMAVGDMTANGRPDVVLAGISAPDYAYTIQVLLNNGDGTLQPPITSSFGQLTTPQNYIFDPDSLALGDFTGDGKLDVVAASSADQRVLVSMGSGDGTLKPPVSYTTDDIPRDAMTFPVADLGVRGIVVGDFHHDGKLDIAAANSGAQTVSVLPGNGDGTFQKAVNDPIGSQPNDLIAGDFNGDGNLDLAVADRFTNSVLVLDGNGDGSFRPPVKAADVNGPMSMAVGDLNHDGLSDLVLTDVVYNNGMPISYAVSSILATRDASQNSTTNAAFLARVYQQLLGREIDPAASVYWNRFLQNGGTQPEVAHAIGASVEYRTNQVQSAYQRYLGRGAEPDGLQFFLQMLESGHTMEDVTATIIGSPEYVNRVVPQSGQTIDNAFVEATFQQILGRRASSGDVAYFDSLLARGVSHYDVAASVLASAEYRAEHAHDV